MRVVLAIALFASLAQAQFTYEEIDLTPHVTTWHSEGYSQWWLQGNSIIDYDLDGDGDIFTTSHNDIAGCMILRNNGDGTFTDVTVQLLGSRQVCKTAAGKPIIGDANQDGWPDIIGLHGAPTLLNQGGTSFVAAGNAININYGQSTDPDVEPGVKGLGDRNGDGYPDVTDLKTDAIWNPSTDQWDIGPSSYVRPTGLPANVEQAAVNAEAACFFPQIDYYETDQDGDGSQDDYFVSGYAAYCSTGRFFYVVRQEPVGTFTDVTAAVGFDSSGYLIRAHDWTGDGRLDLLVGRGNQPGFYIANTDNTYTRVPNADIEQQVSDTYSIDYAELAFAPDLNGDGLDELVLEGRYSKWKQVFENLGNGQFARGPNTVPSLLSANGWGGGSQSMDWGNIDGRLGVVVGVGNPQSSAAGIKLWVFDGSTPPPPPSLPLTITSPPQFPLATCNQAYSEPIEVTGGSGGPYQFSISGGELPAGMSVVSGAVNGVPSSLTATATVQVYDPETGQSTSQEITFVLNCG